VLDFRESTNAELSTIEAFHQSDGHAENRNNGRVYQVRTISLMDMLLKYNAPAEIDYLSIDTEGSELEILKALDYDKYRIRLITCEHNHTFMRSKIKELLTKKGYAIVNRDFADFDDWYELA
jgi:FkbM family methyltransferase